MAEFARALGITLGHEGGLSDHVADRGGRTSYGVTTATYDDYRRSLGLPTQRVDHITVDEVRAIYRERYWAAARCDEFAWPVSLCLFDAAVNHGVGRGVRLLQRALGVTDDGVVGPMTIAAAAASIADDETIAARDMLWERAEYFAIIVRNDPSQAAFILGWTRRLRELRETVLGRDQG